MEPFPRSSDPGGDAGAAGGLPPGVPGPGERREPGFALRCVALFTAPRAAFGPPRGMVFWLAPLVAILLFNVLDSILLRDLYNEWFLDFVESNRSITEEQRNAMLETLESRSAGGLGISDVIQTVVGTMASLGTSYFLLGLFYLVGVNFGLAGQARYLDVVGVLSLSAVVLVLRGAITLPLKLSQGTLAIYTGPAALVSQDGGWLATVLGFFDVFDLFRLYLLTIGLSVVGRVSTSRSAILVVAFWILGCGFRIIWKMGPLGAVTP